MQPVIVSYVPILHEGYRVFFDKHPKATELFLFGEDLIGEFDHLRKDIRRLDPELVQKAIQSWNRFERVEILNTSTIEKIQKTMQPLIISDDDLSTALVSKFFPNHPVEVDTIFLRWDKKKSIQPVQDSPDIEISEEAFDQKMMEAALKEGEKAKDWWRHIGAIAVKDGSILFQAHNTYVPSDQMANDEGDPRSNFSAGEHFESSLALHAEASIVAQAAKEGTSLKEADVYCDTFPCPPCAKQLAYSGIGRLFYRNGYAVLDGERILKSQGVKLIFIK